PGCGIPGDDDAVASLFSINRPLTSSKTLRRPTREALGNGLRVVTGAVVATCGTLRVSTRGRTLRLIHDHDSGDTRALHMGPWDGNPGSAWGAARGRSPGPRVGGESNPPGRLQDLRWQVIAALVRPGRVLRTLAGRQGRDAPRSRGQVRGIQRSLGRSVPACP